MNSVFVLRHLPVHDDDEERFLGVSKSLDDVVAYVAANKDKAGFCLKDNPLQWQIGIRIEKVVVGVLGDQTPGRVEQHYNWRGEPVFWTHPRSTQ